ncbi:MAG: hypothetical protein QXR60_04045 [Candidatus Nanoarchaeia archaeon]
MVDNSTVTINEDSSDNNISNQVYWQNYFRDVEDDKNPSSPSVTTNDTNSMNCSIKNGDLICDAINNATGSITIIITAQDSEGLSATTSFEIGINEINDEPWIDLDKPDDDATNTTTNTIDFTFTPYDVENSISNCSLIINEEINTTSTSITPNTINTISVELSNGVYSWSINCTDSYNMMVGAYGTRNITVDYSPTTPTPPSGGGGGGKKKPTNETNVTEIIPPTPSIPPKPTPEEEEITGAPVVMPPTPEKVGMTTIEVIKNFLKEFTTGDFLLLLLILFILLLILALALIIKKMLEKRAAKKEITPEAKKTIAEIVKIMKDTKEMLKKDPEAAAVLYSTIEPLYNTLEQRNKKRIIAEIKKLHDEIDIARETKTLNIEKTTKNNQKEVRLMSLVTRTIFLVLIFTAGLIVINEIIKTNQISYTGYAIVEPSIGIELQKQKYLGEEKLDGYINITFNGNVDADSEIIVEFDNNREKMKLREYLSSINKTFKSTAAETITTNPESRKNFTFTANEEKTFGLKLPAGANIDGIQMRVVPGSSPVMFLTMDVPEESGKPEWKYIGNFLGTYGTLVLPEGLQVNNEGSIQYVESNETYYCQQIDLPYAKNYQISAKYKPVTTSTANLHAVLLSFEGGVVAYGGLQKCLLPRGSSISSWNACNLNIEKAIQGYYLICLLTDKNEKAYEVSRDNAVAVSKYNCQMGVGEDWGMAYCSQEPSKNYFIRIAPGQYQGNLTSMITPDRFNDWESDKAFNESLTEMLSYCTPDQIGDCALTVKIKAESDGFVELSDLRIDFTEMGGSTSYTTTFYDISTTRPEIYEIDNQSMNNYTLKIPLSTFNITTTPNVTKKTTKDLYVSVAGRSQTEKIEVYTTAVPEAIQEVEEMINEAIQKLQALKTEEIAWVLKVEDSLLTLENFKTQIEEIKKMNISMEEKEEKLATIQGDIEAFIQTLPWKVTKISEVRDNMVVNPSDIEELFTENIGEIFEYQEKVSVQITLIVYKVTNTDGTSDVYSVVKKTISPKASITDAYVYEVIPKEVAQSLSDITFEKPNFEVERADPIVKFYYNTLTSTTIMYVVKTMVTTARMYELKTLVVPKKMPTTQIPQKTYECGNGRCERPDEDEEVCPEDCKTKGKVPWLWIAIILLILVLGIVYINFYRGKMSMGKIMRKKSPFKTEKDLEAVKNYIKAQLAKGVKKVEISKALLEKGWTKAQVEYAFEDIKWDKKRDETMKKAPYESDDMKKLTTYITTCKKLNIKEDKIIQSLKAKGWKDSVIQEGLKRVNAETKQEAKHEAKEESKKTKAKPFFEQKGL